MKWKPLPPQVREALGLAPVPPPWRLKRGAVVSLLLSVGTLVYLLLSPSPPRWLLGLLGCTIVLHDVMDIAIERVRHLRAQVEEETHALRVSNAFTAGASLPRIPDMRKEMKSERPN